MNRLAVGATLCLLVLYLGACEKKPPSMAGKSRKQMTGSYQGAEIQMRRRTSNIDSMAAIALEGGMTLPSFREGAVVGEVRPPMTDGCLKVAIRLVQRRPYFNSMARISTADYEYIVLFTIANRTSSKKVIDTIEGIIYSESLEPVIRTITCYCDETYNVHQTPTELAAGEFDEFQIPSMGREGSLQSVGIALTYQDKTESRFWVPVPPDKIVEVTGDN